ncbi:hypothetical protein MTR_2g033610 [Medicago truncatula]|uniref:Uncharacterized protein n=1 Tax=Medicago truncatula TaxID=3880 RepID=G7IMR0_MEDTR|nr:hypothetical protein MTR_2g033610 [Medicago truncatula]
MDLWRNGSASDSRSEGCVFDSRQVHYPFLCSFLTENASLEQGPDRKRLRKRALRLFFP